MKKIICCVPVFHWAAFNLFVSKRLSFFPCVSYELNEKKGFVIYEIKTSLFYFLQVMKRSKKRSIEFRIRESINDKSMKVECDETGKMSINGFKVVGIVKGEFKFE